MKLLWLARTHSQFVTFACGPQRTSRMDIQGGGGSTYTRVNTYSTQPSSSDLPETGTNVTTAWSSSVSVTKGDYTVSNGVIWQADSTGTTGGTPPAIPSTGTNPGDYNHSTDPSTVVVLDGISGVNWLWYSSASHCAFLIESGAIQPTIRDARPTQGGSAVCIKNSISSLATNFPPKEALLDAVQGDHFWNDGIQIDAGIGHSVINSKIQSNVTGRGINVTSNALGSIDIIGNYIYASAYESIKIASGPASINIIGNLAGGGSRASAGNYPSVSVASTKTVVSGNRLGPLPAWPSGPGAGHHNYGLQIESAAADYKVVGNSMEGNDTADYNNLSANDGEGVKISWTPGLAFGATHGGATAATLSGHSGTYIRFGKSLVADFNLGTVSNFNGGSGNAWLDGVPGTCGTQGSISFNFYTSGTLPGVPIGGIVSPGNNFGNLYYWGTGGVGALTNTAFTNPATAAGRVECLIQ